MVRIRPGLLAFVHNSSYREGCRSRNRSRSRRSFASSILPEFDVESPAKLRRDRNYLSVNTPGFLETPHTDYCDELPGIVEDRVDDDR